MSTHTDIVDAYMDGFRRSDKPAILALLSDDVAWDLPGFRHLTGKADFEGEIVNPQFEENPTLVVDRNDQRGDLDDLAVATGGRACGSSRAGEVRIGPDAVAVLLGHDGQQCRCDGVHVRLPSP